MFYILGFILSGAVLANTVTFCTMGDYQYTGPVYSDSQTISKTRGQEACLERKGIDSDKIGEEYRANRSKIDTLISEMLVNPECQDVKHHLEAYQAKLLSHETILKYQTQERIVLLKSFVKDIDIQRTYAYLASFNATCSGGHNRRTSFINLDLINNLPNSEPLPTVIGQNNQTSDSCSDVVAFGGNDLKGFKVSMKKNKGKDFILSWDPYGVPDQIQVTSSSGEELYNSGCKGSRELESKNITLGVPKNSDLIINVLNNCKEPSQKGMSTWELRIKCEVENTLCQVPKNELSTLLKREVDLTKKIIDTNSLYRECLNYMYEDVLGDLLAAGLIGLENAPLENGVCDVMDEECLNKSLLNKDIDKESPPPERAVAAEVAVPSLSCSEKGQEDESIWEQISRAYCKIGRKKLGIPLN